MSKTPKYTVQTSKGKVRFYSVSEPIEAVETGINGGESTYHGSCGVCGETMNPREGYRHSPGINWTMCKVEKL